MDLSSLLSTVISPDSINAISKNSGAKPSQVSDLLSKAVPLLLKGMQQNASTEHGASSLAQALDQHAASNTSNIGSYLSNIDLSDGAKILGHIFGGNNSKVQSGLAQKTGLSAGQVGSILSSVAPLLLSLVGSKKQSSNTGLGGLGGLLGGLLGSQSSGGLDSLLSSALADKDGDGKPDILGKVGGLFGF
ncbi:MAG: DUF937 domain-containing protein [Tannerella sp.]|jgi:hypothetical protein|nr:DUF937 domain-containing protein [Tannerella sp.]